MSFPDISELIPQRGPAQWLDRVLALEPPRLSCSGRLPISASPSLVGSSSGVLCLELLAQAAAAYGALTQPRYAGQEGLIVSVSRLVSGELEVPRGVELCIEVHEEGRVGRASRFGGWISLGGQKMVEAEFLVVLAQGGIVLQGALPP